MPIEWRPPPAIGQGKLGIGEGRAEAEGEVGARGSRGDQDSMHLHLSVGRAERTVGFVKDGRRGRWMGLPSCEKDWRGHNSLMLCSSKGCKADSLSTNMRLSHSEGDQWRAASHFLPPRFGVWLCLSWLSSTLGGLKVQRCTCVPLRQLSDLPCSPFASQSNDCPVFRLRVILQIGQRARQTE